MRADGDDTLFISHHGYRLDVRRISGNAAELAYAQVLGGHKVLEYQHTVECKRTYRFNMSCVSAIINIIGIRHLFAFTPYSLYGALLGMGAVEMEL